MDREEREQAIAALEAAGWVMVCESPLELQHEDGSFASLNAARFLIDNYKELIAE